MLLINSSEDGKKWSPCRNPLESEWPEKVTVGIMAEGTAKFTFKAVFDQFRLTPLSGRSAARPGDAGR
jgi:regulation of enolase protein 1 (concanavalin A-like superfamily)